MNKRILFITATRADYGKIEPLAISCLKCGHIISFYVTGMHMLKKYGETRFEVRKFISAEIYEQINQNENDELEHILAKTISSLSDYLANNKPDLVVIHGDRIEALAASIVCSTKYIHSAHIEGGEMSGTIDEIFRHCNTKLCTTHFVSSEQARDRVISLGEDPCRVYVIGSPELDTHSKELDISIIDVKNHYNISFGEYGIVIFHPVTSERDSIRDQSYLLFKSLHASRKKFIVISPNNDPGSQDIFNIINSLPPEQFKIIPSMRFLYFSILLRHSSLIIGNSSAGVREAPFLGIPSLDIGTRQSQRAKGDSIFNCDARDDYYIQKFIFNQWGKRYDANKSFGTGNSAENFTKILSDAKFWAHSLQKNFYQKELDSSSNRRANA